MIANLTIKVVVAGAVVLGSAVPFFGQSAMSSDKKAVPGDQARYETVLKAIKLKLDPSSSLSSEVPRLVLVEKYPG
jgi:hypothetical protein